MAKQRIECRVCKVKATKIVFSGADSARWVCTHNPCKLIGHYFKVKDEQHRNYLTKFV